MENFLLSVVVPNYNKRKYLDTCIQSILKQSYRPLEVIVVDDCSTDDSVKIITNLQNSYPKSELKLIKLDVNCGVSKARNIGLAAAEGEYVTFLDSDDFYFDSQKLENEMKLIADNRGLSILSYSKIVFVDEMGEKLQGYALPNSEYLQGDILRDVILEKNHFICTIRDYCVKKSILQEVGGYSEGMNLFEDLDVLLRLLPRCNAVCTFQDGTAHRLNTNGLSNRTERDILTSKWKVCFKNAKDLKTRKHSIMLQLIIKRLIFEAKLFVNVLCMPKH